MTTELELPTNLRLSAHGVPVSPALRKQLVAEMGHLENHYDRLIACDLRLEGPSEKHRKGAEFRVSLTLQLPGPDIHVSKQRDTDLERAVRSAFATARHQLDGRKWGKRPKSSARSA